MKQEKAKLYEILMIPKYVGVDVCSFFHIEEEEFQKIYLMPPHLTKVYLKQLKKKAWQKGIYVLYNIYIHTYLAGHLRKRICFESKTKKRESIRDYLSIERETYQEANKKNLRQA